MQTFRKLPIATPSRAKTAIQMLSMTPILAGFILSVNRAVKLHITSAPFHKGNIDYVKVLSIVLTFVTQESILQM